MVPFSPFGLGQYSVSLSCEDAAPGCSEGPQTLCLAGDRFEVEVDYRTRQGDRGPGRAEEMTPDTGYFWFFDKDNVEMVVKVLDVCSFANRFWVFAGGLTDVEVEMRVTDTAAGVVRTYQNPLGEPFQPLQDTRGFATWP